MQDLHSWELMNQRKCIRQALAKNALWKPLTECCHYNRATGRHNVMAKDNVNMLKYMRPIKRNTAPHFLCMLKQEATTWGGWVDIWNLHGVVAEPEWQCTLRICHILERLFGQLARAKPLWHGMFQTNMGYHIMISHRNWKQIFYNNKKTVWMMIRRSCPNENAPYKMLSQDPFCFWFPGVL